MFRDGDSAIRPGELPAAIGETRGRVSFEPSIMIKAPKKEVELTPCEAKTRLSSPLGGFLGLLEPQEMKPRLAHDPTTRARMVLFKRHAPNDMKKGDLIAKWWIITDPARRLTRRSSGQVERLCFFRPFRLRYDGGARIASHPVFSEKHMASDFLAR